jgi:hypothetical protein
MTAYVIPNAILVTTYGSEYTFASFLTRDTVYDLMHSLWHPYQPAADQIEAAGNDDVGKKDAETNGTDQDTTQVKHKATECACAKDGQHYSTVVADYILPGTPEKIYEFMFNSPFMNDFLINNQKLQGLLAVWSLETCFTSLTLLHARPSSGRVVPQGARLEATIARYVIHQTSFWRIRAKANQMRDQGRSHAPRL